MSSVGKLPGQVVVVGCRGEVCHGGGDREVRGVDREIEAGLQIWLQRAVDRANAANAILIEAIGMLSQFICTAKPNAVVDFSDRLREG